MNRWLVALLPLAGAIIAGVLFDLAPSDTTYQLLSLAANGLAAAGALVGAAQFAPGDYQRRAWALIGLCYGLLFLNTLVFSLLLDSRGAHADPTLELVRGVITLVANASSILGLVLIGRVWRVAGLELPFSRTTVALSTLAFVALGLILSGPSMVENVQALTGGSLTPCAELASSLGDTVSLMMLTPILLTAFALRGGSLMWPWAMSGLSSLAWLVYDGAQWAGDHFQVNPEQISLAGTVLRVMACLFQLSSGLLQRSVMQVDSSS
jgi:hypothetical protein